VSSPHARATERTRLRDAVRGGLLLGRGHNDHVGIRGIVAYELAGPDGRVRQAGRCTNLITDAGDQYNASRVAAAVAPQAPADVTKVIGMKLGTGTTAVAKNGAGAALVTYQTGSHKAFDATYPNTQSLGAGLGWTITYRCTYGAGVVTVNGLAEVVIIAEATLTDATNAAATTMSRALLSPVVNKGASDTLTITWTWKYLGA
jgi:hypothetical protein